MDQERQMGWINTPGQWLLAIRCTRSPRHILYLEEWMSGELDTPKDDPIWCPWGDGGTMERLPGEFEVAVTGAMRKCVHTAVPSPSA